MINKTTRNYPIAVPNISGNEKKYLNECIDTEFVSSVGPFVDKFEQQLIDCSNFQNASAVSSGTAALSIAQYALSVQSNDLVIIPDYTFIATANSVAHNKASPWIMDINNKDLNIDFSKAVKEIIKNCSYKNKKWIHKTTKQELKCIIPVMALGNCISSKDIEYFNEKIGIPIILDAAGALGSNNGEESIGNLNVLAATISFNGNKTFTCGGGGAVLTNNLEFHNKIKHLSTTARSGYEYIHDQTAFNYRMTNVQAAIGCAQLERFNEFMQNKKFINDYYKKNITSSKITFPVNINSSHWLSYFIAKKLNKKQIYDLYSYSNKKGIYLRPFWIPMHKQPPYAKSLHSSLTSSKKAYIKIVTLPSSTALKKNDLIYITKIINNYLKGLNG